MCDNCVDAPSLPTIIRDKNHPARSNRSSNIPDDATPTGLELRNEFKFCYCMKCGWGVGLSLITHMKNKLLVTTLFLVLFGAGCAATNSNVTTKTQETNEGAPDVVQKTSIYKNAKMGYEFEYPQGWYIEEFGTPDNDVLDWKILKPEPSKNSVPSTNVIFFSKNTGLTYNDESKQVGALTGQINGKYYVINYLGGEKESGFNFVAETFSQLK